MPAADLDGPLQEFRDRLNQIRRILALTEASSKQPGLLSTSRSGVKLDDISLITGNTASAMALVFLASSFEEFVREEIGQCGGYLVDRYAGLTEIDRHNARSSYWSICLDKAKYLRGILTKGKPRAVDLVVVSKVKSIIESAQGFVVADDPSFIIGNNFGHHSNNFKPHVVNEIAGRIGLKDLIASASEHSKVKAHFGVTTKGESSRKLATKLDNFYDRRNEIVHSLSASSGYGVDILFDYIELFEATADGIRAALLGHIAKW
jgi:hypothetical protein